MRVVAASLIDGISITLVDGDDGWRFGSWIRSGMVEGGRPLADPPPDARARRFASQHDAMVFFRGLCPLPS